MNRFIAAMDHSGGSSPGVLETYGYTNAHELPHEVVMDDIHLMRLRMVNHPDFHGENISHAILYKDTVDRGMVDVLSSKGVRAILKIDSGCRPDGTLKDYDVKAMIDYAKLNGCVGTKMRSIVKTQTVLDDILFQQFSMAQEISNAGLMPIVEPEVPIDHLDKKNVEFQLNKNLKKYLKEFNGSVILKLTLPEEPNLYKDLNMYSTVNKIVGLSGGYTTQEACRRLSENSDMTASFSRGLSEGLLITQTDEEFNERLAQNIKMIVQAGEDP
jgi:fructose-bisphosphate aldolase class I